MTTGTIHSYDAEKGEGFIHPDADTDAEKIPFEAADLEGFREGDPPRKGERVAFEASGGMIGVIATKVRRLQ